MAAQLIVGASRAVGKKVVERSTRDLEGGIERSRRVRKLEGRAVSSKTQQQNRQQNLSSRNIPPVKKVAMPKGVHELIKKAEALRASLTTLWIAGALWALQFGIWAFGMVGLGIEKIPGANILYPGISLFEFSYFFIGIIGIITLIFVAGVFLVSKVDCFSGSKLLIFAVTFCLYWLPFLGLFPWFGLWLIAVIYLQNED